MREHNNPKNTAPEDWHRADVICALRKAGWSLRQLSIHHNYTNPGTLKTALDRRWPKGERLIAEAIGVHPAEIWPSRYRDRTTQATSGHQAPQREVA